MRNVKETSSKLVKRLLDPTHLNLVLCVSLLFMLAGCSSTDESTTTHEKTTSTWQKESTRLDAVNSNEDDFAPVVVSDGSLIFTSNRAGDGRGVRIDAKSKFGEAMYAARKDNGAWMHPQPMNIGGSANKGTMVEMSQGDQIIFGASYLQPTLGGTDIYVIRKSVGQWSSPELMRELSSKWWDAHPAISSDGRMIVFSSDREEKNPDADTQGQNLPVLWISTRDDQGQWSSPVKLPSPINSGKGEISPFISHDGFLYFATRRFDQGFDIVRSRLVNDIWSEPERLGEPINSAHDDVFPFVQNDRTTMLFASDRPGGKGGLDLYAASLPYRITLEGTITLRDDGGDRPAPSSKMTLTDLSTNETRVVEADASGQYRTELRPERTYRLSPGGAECYRGEQATELKVSVPISFDTTHVRNFLLERAAFPTFQLGRYNIPFFVTGYYHPNTRANLDNLERRINSGELRVGPGGNTPYIDLGDEDYRSYASRIEAIFDTVFTSITNQILPSFNSCALATEKLKIEVRGFVDPRGLAYGSYIDKTVDTDNMRIEKGSAMSGQEGNRKLAELRAYYTAEMIDAELSSRSQAYRDLKAQGRILLSPKGVGIDVETAGEKLQDPAKRRIDIKLVIISGTK